MAEKTANPANSATPQDPRTATILEYYPLVRKIAQRMLRSLPSSFDVEECTNIGAIGLIDAVDRFNPKLGVPFKAYAEIRIRGQIMDAFRSADWTPRSVRKKASSIDSTYMKLRMALNREPTRHEMSKAMELSPQSFDKLCSDARIHKMVSLDSPIDSQGDLTLIDTISTDESDFDEIWVQKETRQAVVDAIKHLPRKERTTLSLYYLNGLTLKEIGQVLGVSESRVCQIRSQGVNRLKTRLKQTEK